ncbi:ABC transporter permease [Cutibacterium equinum]|uniref:ABC transporter permease n=1 Tax=Cutibacterium equinum TaxID=3016342 RepID=A0ABY7R1B4_9ACTN|nr:ABC transporter permease [Cutibacterium equinum]WCC80312.1 ABC transporter permease [Cutibacterium equinum]
MNATYALLDIRRMVRTPAIVIFAFVMPVAMYVLFGAIQNYGNLPVPHGNVKATVMASLALYGAATAASGLGASSALEQDAGWGRQLATTPMTQGKYLLTKVVAIQIVAAVPVALVLLVGALSGARIDGIGWLWTFLLAWVCCIPYTVFGLAIAMFIRNENAATLVSFFVLAFAFLGNVFMPLGGFMLKLSRFTPLWGVNLLPRWPIMGGYEMTIHEPVEVNLSYAIMSAVVWAGVFAVLAWLASRRHQDR